VDAQNKSDRVFRLAKKIWIQKIEQMSKAEFIELLRMYVKWQKQANVVETTEFPSVTAKSP